MNHLVDILIRDKKILAVIFMAIFSAIIQIIFAFSIYDYTGDQEFIGKPEIIGLTFISTSIVIWITGVVNQYVADSIIETKISDNLGNILTKKNIEISKQAAITSEVPRLIYTIAMPFYDSLSKVIALVAYAILFIYTLIEKIKFINLNLLIIWSMVLSVVVLFLAYVIKNKIKIIGDKISLIWSERLIFGNRIENNVYLLKYDTIYSYAKKVYKDIVIKFTNRRTLQIAYQTLPKLLIESAGISMLIVILFFEILPNEVIAILIGISIRALPFAIQILTNINNIFGNIHAIDYLSDRNETETSMDKSYTNMLNLKGKKRLIRITGDSGSGKSTLLKQIDTIGMRVDEKDYTAKDIYLMKTRPLFIKNEIQVLTEKVDYNQLEELSLEDISTKSEDYLSTGEMTRLDFIRMRSVKPKVLLIDEALSNLDKELRYKIGRIIKNDRSLSAIIYVSHYDVKEFDSESDILKIEELR